MQSRPHSRTAIVGGALLILAASSICTACQKSSGDTQDPSLQCSPPCTDAQICCYRHIYGMANPDGGEEIYPPSQLISYDPVCVTQIDGGYGINAVIDGGAAMCAFQPAS